MANRITRGIAMMHQMAQPGCLVRQSLGTAFGSAYSIILLAHDRLCIVGSNIRLMGRVWQRMPTPYLYDYIKAQSMAMSGRKPSAADSDTYFLVSA